MSSANTTPTITSGVEMEQKAVICEITNFDSIRKHASMINAQTLEITAGDKIGQPSKWIVYLRVNSNYCFNWIGIFYKCEEGLVKKEKYLASQCSFTFKNKTGKTIMFGETAARSGIFLKKIGFGFPCVMLVNGWKKRKSLTIHITLKLYGPANQNCRIERPVQVQQLLEQFQSHFTAKVGKDLGRLLQNPFPGDVKVISGDRKKEFLVPMGILAVRSPVLEAMLKSNMSESNEGLICLSDLSDKSLDVLLHFIYTGELLPSWKEGEVVLELTNAAAKYQLLDLLGFLDMTVGKVCVVENALPLFNLATLLQLKNAEMELVKFVREKGTSSAEAFRDILGANLKKSYPEILL